MNIMNEWQFDLILSKRGINKLDYENLEDVISDAIETHDQSIIDYIIKNHKDEITLNGVLNALGMPFVVFKRVLSVANFDKYTLENVVMKFLELNTMLKDDYKYIELFFEKYNVDPNGKDGMIFTHACKYGAYGIVTYLVEERNIDPNINDEMGYPLAIRFENYLVAKYLVDHGANYKTRNCFIFKLLQKIKNPNQLQQELIDLYKEE